MMAAQKKSRPAGARGNRLGEVFSFALVPADGAIFAFPGDPDAGGRIVKE